MGCFAVEVELDLVVHLADCLLSSAVAVVFDQVSIGNGIGGKTAKTIWIGMLHFVITIIIIQLCFIEYK